MAENAGNYPDLPHVEAPAFDYARLLAAWVEGDPYQPEAGTEAYYRTKAQIAAHLTPRRVVEIGVRAGYSALAFHMGHPYEDFYGLDMDEGGWGGEQGYMQHARQYLVRLPGLQRFQLERGNSQLIKTLPPLAQRADLFHVDGDHSPKGTAHDILLAIQSGARHIVVDDYDFIPHVAEGADWAIATFGLTAWYAGDGGYRGNVVIEGKANVLDLIRGGTA